MSTDPGHEDLAEETAEETATESSPVSHVEQVEVPVEHVSEESAPAATHPVTQEASETPADHESVEQSLREDPAYVDDSGELPLLVPARERFAGLDPVPVTGDARVDAATARLDEIVALPTLDQVEVYEDVHRRLQDALADADPH